MVWDRFLQAPLAHGALFHPLVLALSTAQCSQPPEVAGCPWAWRCGGEGGCATPGGHIELDHVDQDGGLPDLEAGYQAPVLPALPPHSGEPGEQSDGINGI